MWLKNLAIVLPDNTIQDGEIAIEDGFITEIRTNGNGGSKTVNRSGLIAIPGLVDIHGDMIEREIEPRPKSRVPIEMALLELDKRLAATGITTSFAAISFADFGGMSDSTESLRAEHVARQIAEVVSQMQPHLCTTMLIHARFEVTHPAAIPVITSLIAAGQLQMLSLMDHTPGQGQFRDLESYVTYMANWLKAERREIEATIQTLTAGRDQALHNLREVGRLVVEHGLVLASHDDDTAAKIRLMDEVQVKVSEFPITLEAAAAAKECGMWVAMGAPNAMRGGSHSGNLSAKAVWDAGLLDILMTDYYPPAMLQAAFAWVHDGLLTLPQAIKLVSTNPAQSVGLTDRGTLAVGQRADIVLIRPTSVGSFRYPRVAATVCGGRLVYQSEPIN